MYKKPLTNTRCQCKVRTCSAFKIFSRCRSRSAALTLASLSAADGCCIPAYNNSKSMGMSASRWVISHNQVHANAIPSDTPWKSVKDFICDKNKEQEETQHRNPIARCTQSHVYFKRNNVASSCFMHLLCVCPLLTCSAPAAANAKLRAARFCSSAPIRSSYRCTSSRRALPEWSKRKVQIYFCEW